MLNFWPPVYFPMPLIPCLLQLCADSHDSLNPNQAQKVIAQRIFEKAILKKINSTITQHAK